MSVYEERKTLVTNRLVTSKHPNEPYRSRDGNIKLAQKVQEIMSPNAVRNAFPEFIEWNVGICKVREVLLAASIV